MGDSSSAEQAARKVEASTTGLGTAMDTVHSKARTAFGGVSAAIAASGLPLGPLQGGLDQLGGAWERSGGKAATAGKLMAGVGVGMAGLGAIAIKFAEPLEKAHAELQQVVQNTGTSFKSIEPAVESLDKHMENFGHRSSDTEEALSKLTAATHDPTEAMKEMSIVSEVAAYHHSSLTAAAEQLAKVHGGSTRALKEFGINVTAMGSASKDAAKSQKELESSAKAVQTAQDNLAKATQHLHDLEAEDAGKKKLTIQDEIALRDARQAVATDTTKLSEAEKAHAAATTAAGAAAAAVAAGPHKDTASVLQLIHDKIKGVDEAQADTFGGKLDAAKAHIEDFAASVGEHAGKALIAFGPAIAGVGALVDSNLIPNLAKGAAATVGFVAEHTVAAATYIASNVAMAASATAAFIAENAATLGIGVAIAALVAGIVWLFKNWHEVWDGIKAVISDAWTWIKGHIDLIIDVALGPLGIAINFLRHHWEEIWGAVKSVVGDAWGFISGTFNAIIGGFNGLVGFVAGIPGRIASAARGMFDGILDAFRSAINFVIRGWNSLHFGIPEIDTHIPGIGKIGGGDFGVPQIPYLAHGGFIDRATVAMIGEAGRELVLPLTDHARTMQLLSQSGVLRDLSGSLGDLSSTISGASGGAVAPSAESTGGAQQVTYEITLAPGSIVVQGHVLTEEDLIDVVHSGLVQKFRREGDLQITTNP